MVEIEDVSFFYAGRKKALSHIDLAISPGECVLLCGESGCGKTTVAKLLNGLIPADARMYELAKTVGSVFQNPKSQFFNLDSDSELSFGLENEGLPPPEIEKRVRETVSDLNIGHLEHRSLFSMSGGEKQALAFASVYAMRPRIFVLDEPSANLDAESIEVLRRQIEQAKKNGHTVVIAEHRLYFLAGLADRIVYLKDGRIGRTWGREAFTSLSRREQTALGLRSVDPPVLRLPEAGFMSEESGLLVSGLSYAYKKNTVLKDVRFSARPGDIIGIAGRNGIGKTTFCRCLCGLLKKQSGTISFHGRPLSRRECRKLCAFVMQDVNHQLFSDSVWDECGLSAPGASEEQIESVLDRFDLLPYRETHPMALSGGQKQRLAVAAAVLSRKKVLIFDEPTSGLDYRRMMEVSAVLRQLGESGHIILVVSHDTEFLNETCTGIFRL